ncbi:DNA ligase [Trichinella spiralis]|uniref:DNA ligase n=1 Tax=Trichinella spiralis TaxID=6334 RepID=A0ABR3KWZ9_TRISP
MTLRNLNLESNHRRGRLSSKAEIEFHPEPNDSGVCALEQWTLNRVVESLRPSIVPIERINSRRLFSSSSLNRCCSGRVIHPKVLDKAEPFRSLATAPIPLAVHLPRFAVRTCIQLFNERQ